MTTLAERWRGAESAERANYQQFLLDLCDALGVGRPEPSSHRHEETAYGFERGVAVRYADGSVSHKRIDLYKRGCFLLEAKQGSNPRGASERERLGLDTGGPTGTEPRGSRAWERMMKRAYHQALDYVRNLPPEEGAPPFVLVVDVGYCVDVYANFSGQGGHYTPFPNANESRILMEGLETRAAEVERLRRIWEDPQSLDPSRRAARVTRELADRLARLATSLEAAGHAPGRAAQFLMRALFTMFAEDAGLLPERAFAKLLLEFRETPDFLRDALEELWRTMDRGGRSLLLRAEVPQFNGALFRDAEALPLTAAQAELLLEAARADWKEVEPAIFGTLLERALDPVERHKLGAHYTPRAYVERLVRPAVIDPLRGEWTAVQAAVVLRESQGDLAGAREEILRFHRERLCRVRVLDPACGSGNFLYVTLALLKELEGEVLKALEGYGGQQTLDMTGGYSISPAQFLGLEVNPRAAAIADVVLWIGYLQWHIRTRGDARRLDPPILRDYKNIRRQDAVLAYDGEPTERRDAAGEPVTRWDGRSFKRHPATGENVPDDAARIPVYDYANPRPAAWPEAEFIVGNPPFLGKGKMRDALGDGYTEALRKAYRGVVPDSADFVMYWWQKAAELVRTGKAERFGFITTNSLPQTFNRRVVQAHLQAEPPLSLLFAVPDHPWVETADGAAVRIAMTVGEAGRHDGQLQLVVSENPSDELGRDVVLAVREGWIASDLTVGADVASVSQLKANIDIASMGMMLAGSGFKVTLDEARELGLGSRNDLDKFILPYRNGRDLTQRPRGFMVIDLFGLSLDDVSQRYPEVYQHVLDRVKPERDQNQDQGRRTKWWIFGRTNEALRAALAGVDRYIATAETAKHRFFQFLEAGVRPDHMLAAVASRDAFHLGVLSSGIHVSWALATGGTLEDRPRYNKSRCFETFPFPAATDAQKEEIRKIAERLDAFRWERLRSHEGLTMTGLYNVLETLRRGEALGAKEKEIHAQGLVSVLKELHDELDAAVAAAYGWASDLPEAEILTRLVALNRERAAEEARGVVRWLRPAYQNRSGVQGGLGMEEGERPGVVNPSAASRHLPYPGEDPERRRGTKDEGRGSGKEEWPGSMAERVRAVQRVLVEDRSAVRPEEVAGRFAKGKRAARVAAEVADVLKALEALGLARRVGEDRWAG